MFYRAELARALIPAGSSYPKKRRAQGTRGPLHLCGGCSGVGVAAGGHSPTSCVHVGMWPLSSHKHTTEHPGDQHPRKESGQGESGKGEADKHVNSWGEDHSSSQNDSLPSLFR